MTRTISTFLAAAAPAVPPSPGRWPWAWLSSERPTRRQGRGKNIFVDNAKVTKPNVMVSKGVIHVINSACSF